MNAKILVLVMLVIASITPAVAQTAGPEATAVDLTLLARANGGDASAQVQMGDNSCAAGSGAARNSKELAEYYKIAAEWYRKSAAQGYQPARDALKRFGLVP